MTRAERAQTLEERLAQVTRERDTALHHLKLAQSRVRRLEDTLANGRSPRLIRTRWGASVGAFLEESDRFLKKFPDVLESEQLEEYEWRLAGQVTSRARHIIQRIEELRQRRDSVIDSDG